MALLSSSSNGETSGINLASAVTLFVTDFSQSLRSIVITGPRGAAWIAVWAQSFIFPQRSKIERQSCAIAFLSVKSIGASVLDPPRALI